MACEKSLQTGQTAYAAAPANPARPWSDQRCMVEVKS